MEVIKIPTFDSQSFKRILIRNVLFPLGISVLSTIIFVGLILYQLSVQNEAEKSIQVLAQAGKVEKLVMDSETGMRGFLLTGREPFLKPFLESSPLIPAEIESLRQLVEESPLQLNRVNSIETNFNQWIKVATSLIDERRQGDTIEDEDLSGIGKRHVDQIRASFNDLLDQEELTKRRRSEDSQITALYLVILVVGISLLFGVLIAWMGRKQLLELSRSYDNALAKQLEHNENLLKEQRLKSNIAKLSEIMVGERRVDELCDSVLSCLATILNFSVGSIYVVNDEKGLDRRGRFAISNDLIEAKERFSFGEGLVGQGAKEDRVLSLSDIPENYIKISSSLGEMKPKHLLVYPIKSDNKVTAVLELGFVDFDSEEVLRFLSGANESMGQSIRSAKFGEKLESLLHEVREQAKALQAQQEELRVSNEELEEQTKLQRESQARLEAQHAELEQTNTQLETQSRMLELQKEDLNYKNEELSKITLALEQKTSELEQSSRYKSEFLANMSHELRTPLNSSLILAKLLADNKEGNLTQKQVEFSKQILNSGNDLLMLINDVLDLSKVESGKLEIVQEEFAVSEMFRALEKMFTPIAKERGLELETVMAPESPEVIKSDRQRVEQILKNLLSNAFKFTPKGKVRLEAAAQGNEVAFSVTDSGIGIKPSQQKIIFEAFRQADGTTNRKFGGTGLGLSISKDLARLLQGELHLTSEEGVGSTFTLTLPLKMKEQEQITAPEPIEESLKKIAQQISTQSFKNVHRQATHSTTLNDDRGSLKESDRSILVIEDDLKFSEILMDLIRELGFKCLATDTASEGIQLATAHSPDAILLDIGLPDHSGLVVIDQLKQDPATRHIPIHVVSAGDRSDQALQMGAVGYLLKPVEREEIRKVIQALEERIQKDFHDVLIIEDDEVQRNAIEELIHEKEVRIDGVGTGAEALRALKEKPYDCVIMDLNLPDISGFDLIDKLAEDEEISHPPIIVYTGRDLSKDEELRLTRHSQSVIIKGAKSPERLLNEVTLFLHQVESRLSPKRKKILEQLRNRERAFENKRIMIVDDDVRNIFALTSALEQKGATVIMARHGQEAIDHLNKNNIPDLILMDIMMPVMDGYEATKNIRQRPEFRNVPIIALTAKAMADDREKCIKAGASDYLTKPVNLDKLLSLMRVWLSHAGGFSHGVDRQL